MVIQNNIVKQIMAIKKSSYSEIEIKLYGKYYAYGFKIFLSGGSFVQNG